MKRIIPAAIMLLLATVVCAQSNSINAIIGDVSFIDRFQQLPGHSANELVRIQTHLRYVEHLLRQKNCSHLNKNQRQNRALVLDLLHRYWSNGVFPKNYDYPGRRPCFIDRDGNICAVGYLIEKTKGREVAEKINDGHQYDYLLNMHEQVIEEWAKQYGLSLEECAMIQPTYGNIPSDQTYNAAVKSGYGISSAVLGGVNLGVSVINLSNGSFGRSKAFSCVGLVSGASQIILGLTNIRKEGFEGAINGPSRTISYRSQNNLSYINIAVGTTTLFTSAVNLMLNRRRSDKRNAFNLYTSPDMNNKMIAGLVFTRSL